MTQTEKHTDFTTRLIPKLKRIARSRFRKKRDRDDRTADLIARGWEAYGHSINRGRPPSLRAVLRGANRLWRRSDDLLDQPSVKVHSLSEPSIRRAIANIPA
jgi:DNA-directed RNA polymerase specialized sigma24 family protein